jgi:hypothetical protein
MTQYGVPTKPKRKAKAKAKAHGGSHGGSQGSTQRGKGAAETQRLKRKRMAKLRRDSK